MEDFTDDTALLAGNEKELTELTSKINEVGKQFGMTINIKKTKVMVVSRKPNTPKINIAIDGQQIEQVTSYMYLGSLITEDGRCEKEIKRRIDDPSPALGPCCGTRCQRACAWQTH